MRKVRRDHHRPAGGPLGAGAKWRGNAGRRSGAMAEEAEEEESNVLVLVLLLL